LFPALTNSRRNYAQRCTAKKVTQPPTRDRAGVTRLPVQPRRGCLTPAT
jgi:hypothetical protein